MPQEQNVSDLCVQGLTSSVTKRSLAAKVTSVDGNPLIPAKNANVSQKWESVAMVRNVVTVQLAKNDLARRHVCKSVPQRALNAVPDRAVKARYADTTDGPR